MNQKLLSEVMAYLGSRKSKAKAAASRKNGKLGGRPAGEVSKLAKKLGISRQAAWYRIHKSKAARRVKVKP